MNIDDEIKKYEYQQEILQDKLDELYDIKHSENKMFRDNLVGKCFKDGSSYIRIIKRLDDTYRFEIFEFTNSFSRKSLTDFNTYNSFDYSDIFVQEKSYFDDREEITVDEFLTEFDKLVSDIRSVLA